MCRIWIWINGVPIPAWSTENFNNIMNISDRWLTLKDDASDSISFERARMLTETNFATKNDDSLDLVVDGNIFIIKVQEVELSAKSLMNDMERDVDSSSSYDYGSPLVRRTKYTIQNQVLPCLQADSGS
ncbi:hypothetical protein GQ457_15G014540 [Hibiscus cannabinus]